MGDKEKGPLGSILGMFIDILMVVAVLPIASLAGSISKKAMKGLKEMTKEG